MKAYDTILIQLIKDFQVDFQKAVDGNNAAATRARKTLQTMKNIAQEARFSIQDHKTAMQVNKNQKR